MRINDYDICIITTIHEPFDARIYRRELTLLIKAGYSIALIAPWPKPNIQIPNLTFRSLKYPKNRAMRIIHALKIFYMALTIRARSFLFHDLDFLPFGYLLKKLKKVPIVYDCHENYPEEILEGKEWIPKPLRKPLAEIVRIVENFVVKRIDYVIAVVPYQVRRFNSLGAKCILIRNFTDLRIMENLSHESNNVVYIGSISINYGADLLIDIARELKKRNCDIKLIIADRFGADRKLREYFIDIIKKESLPIIIEPSVPPQKIDKILERGSIGLLIAKNTKSKDLALPMKLFEYMAAGMPIVAANLEVTKDIMGTALCGIVVGKNEAKYYVDAIIRIMNDANLYNLYRANGFRAINYLYNWQNEFDRIVKLFKNVLTT